MFCHAIVFEASLEEPGGFRSSENRLRLAGPLLPRSQATALLDTVNVFYSCKEVAISSASSSNSISSSLVLKGLPTLL